MTAKIILVAVILGLVQEHAYRTKAQDAEIPTNPDVYSKEQCEKNGGENAWRKAQTAGQVFQSCVSNAGIPFGPPAAAAPPNKDEGLFSIWLKNCDKESQLLQCAEQLKNDVKSCFPPREQKGLEVLNSVAKKVANFVCHKETATITEYIANGGSRCVGEKSEQLERCVRILGALSPHKPPLVVFGKKECREFSELEACVVGALESCPAPTSHLFGSLFDTVREATPCNSAPPRGVAVGSLTLMSTAIMVIVAAITY